MKPYRLIYSTVTFGKRVESAWLIYAFSAEDAEHNAPVLEGAKFERVES